MAKAELHEGGAWLPAHTALLSSKDSVPRPQREAIPHTKAAPALTMKGLVEVPAGWLSCLSPSLADPRSLKEEPGKQEQKLSGHKPCPSCCCWPLCWASLWDRNPLHPMGQQEQVFVTTGKKGVEQSQRTQAGLWLLWPPLLVQKGTSSAVWLPNSLNIQLPLPTSPQSLGVGNRGKKGGCGLNPLPFCC